MSFDPLIILTGLLVFAARVTDVTIGTIRIISIVQGRIKTAFLLAFFEISIWILVISMVLSSIHENPVIAVFYALGFATGNVVGILIEKKLSIGNVLLRIISFKHGKKIEKVITRLGYQVITFDGFQGLNPVTEVLIYCKRSQIPKLLKFIKKIEPDIFFVTEQLGVTVNKNLSGMHPPTGWRSKFKKK